MMQVKKPQMESAIMDVARKLFLEQGFEGVTMRALSGAVGITPGNLYVYFRGKDDLYFAVFIERNAVRLERIFSEMEKGGTARERIERYARAYIEWAHDNPREMRFELHYQHKGMGEENLSPSLAERFDLQREPYHRRFCEVFEQGLANGEFNYDMPTGRVISYFTFTLRTMLNEVVVLKYYDDDFYFNWVHFFLDAIT